MRHRDRRHRRAEMDTVTAAIGGPNWTPDRRHRRAEMDTVTATIGGPKWTP